MAVWITHGCPALSSVFQSYWPDRREIMKGFKPWNPVHGSGWKEFHLQWDLNLSGEVKYDLFSDDLFSVSQSSFKLLLDLKIVTYL